AKCNDYNARKIRKNARFKKGIEKIIGTLYFLIPTWFGFICVPQDRRGVYVVEFDRLETGRLEHRYSNIRNQQLVCSPDMLNHTQAHMHSLVPGDAVLSPWEPDLHRYGPGRVVSGMERRDLLTGKESGTGLQVLLWDGRVTQVPGGLAVWIPAPQHERIIRELQRIPPWPCCRDSLLCTRCNVQAPFLYCTRLQHCSLVSTPGHCPVTQPLQLRAPPAYRCGLREGLEGERWQERAELEKKVDHQLGELKDMKEVDPETSSSSSPSEDEEAAGGESFGPVTSIELSPMEKLRPEQGRPAWKYWRRSALEPQHRQPGIQYTTTPKKCRYTDIKSRGSPNHSSVFQTLPGYERRLVTIRDVFGLTDSTP
uniref:DUF4537 domain-containing protein n=1 Tax=Esox lucius TaxID=8010 RepID=A0A6Q2XZ80_ESOLU